MANPLLIRQLKMVPFGFVVKIRAAIYFVARMRAICMKKP